jgi:hypothetical protein
VPSVEEFDLTEKVVHWVATGKDRYARLTFTSTPTEVDARWVDRESQATTADGNTVSLMATVAVKEEIEVGSLLWHGRLSQWPSYAGTEGAYVMQVSTVTVAHDVKGRATRRELGLSRFMDAVPPA